MSWCEHCEDSGRILSTCYYCKLTDEKQYIPQEYVDNLCYNDLYQSRCPVFKKNKETGSLVKDFPEIPSDTFSTSFCFITTVTCEILGKPDDDPTMNGLRGFRDNILQKDEKYHDILKMYDTIGPIIRGEIKKDVDKDKKAESIFAKLERIVDIVNNGEYDRATRRYIMMTLRLVCEYGLQETYRTKRDNNFDYKEGEFIPSIAGHGKKVYKNS